LAVHENLSYMAVGFDNGSIVLFRGDVMRERYTFYLTYLIAEFAM